MTGGGSLGNASNGMAPVIAGDRGDHLATCSDRRAAVGTRRRSVRQEGVVRAQLEGIQARAPRVQQRATGCVRAGAANLLHQVRRGLCGSCLFTNGDPHAACRLRRTSSVGVSERGNVANVSLRVRPWVHDSVGTSQRRILMIALGAVVPLPPEAIEVGMMQPEHRIGRRD